MIDKVKAAYTALAGMSLSFFGVAFHKTWVYTVLPLVGRIPRSLLGAPCSSLFELLCGIAAIALALFARKVDSQSMARILFQPHL